LDQNGIEFVGRKVMAKHLPHAAQGAKVPTTKQRRKGSK
jgi:hypothetical protein